MNETQKTKDVGKSVVAVGITAALSQVLSIIYLVFLARWIGPERYAIHVSIFNLCMISVFLVNWGLDTWLLKKTSEEPLKSNEDLRKVLMLKMAFGLIWAVLLWAIAPLLRPQLFNRSYLAMAILSTLAEALTNSLYTVFLTTGRFNQSSIILLVARFTRMASLVILYFFSSKDLGLIIGIRTAIDLLVLLIAGIIFGLKFGGWKFKFDQLKQTFKDAVPYHASDLLNIVFRQVDVSMVTFLSKNLTAISAYSLMISFFNVISTVILSLMNVLVPSLTKSRKLSADGRKKSLFRTILFFAGLGLLAWAGISLFGEKAINLILGSEYAVVAEWIKNAAVLVFVSSLNVGLTSIIVANNRQGARVVPQLISLIFKIIASLLLFKRFDVEGLRWVYVLSEVLLSIGYLIIVDSIYRNSAKTIPADRQVGDKLKIAFLTFNQEGKGTYLRAYYLAKELVKHGHEVSLLTADLEGKGIHEREEEGLKIITFPRLLKGSFLHGWGMDEMISRLFWLRNKEFDLVHAFECRPTNLIPARYLQNKGALFFTDWADLLGSDGSVNQRSAGIKRTILKILESYYERRRFHKSDGMSVICKPLLTEAYQVFNYPEEKLLLLPNGMQNPKLHPISIEEAREKTGLTKERLIVGYLGSGFKADMAFMYECFSALQAKEPKALLLHVGRSNFHTPDNLAILSTGGISDQDLSVYLSACDIFWFPLNLGRANLLRLPLKLSDYLTIGRPIVTTAAGDLGFWVEKFKAGLVADQASPEAMSDLVVKICHSEELKGKMGENAQKASLEFNYSWAKRAEELQSFYFRRINQTMDDMTNE